MLDSYQEYRKYRNFNQEYLALIEQVKRNREDAHKIVAERKTLDDTVWSADTRLAVALEVEDARRREVEVEDAKEVLEKAEAAIRKKNEQYETAKKDLDDLKKDLTALLNRLKGDRDISRIIDSALLLRLKKELVIKTRNWAAAADFRNKLGMVMENLMGVGSVTEEELALKKEYDTTMKTINTLTDMIEYYEELLTRLLKETTPEEPKEGEDPADPPKERAKTEAEMTADTARAEEILEIELRPRRIERTKNREKISEIISSQARQVDLDPRDMEGINTVEEMKIKRQDLSGEIALLEMETQLFTKHIRQLERKLLLTGTGGIFRYMMSLMHKKPDPLLVDEDENKLKEPEDTEEERVVYRYKVMQREMNRRYNQLLGLKDTLTEDAYAGEEEDDH